MPDYQIKISAVDTATPIVDNAFKKTGKAANDVTGKIANRFRDVFENVTQNATGSFGSVAGGLFKLPGIAGAAAAAILAIGGAAFASAKKYAEANAANDTASAQFLANLNKVKGAFTGIVNFIGEKAVTAFNFFAEATLTAATAQETLQVQVKALNSELLKQNDEFSKLVGAAVDQEKALSNQNKLIAVKSFSQAIEDLEKKRLTASDVEKKDLNAQIALYRQKIILIGETTKALKEQSKGKVDDSFKLQLESAKQLGESILGIFKSIDEANRQAMKEGVEASIAANERDRKEFEDELARKRKVLEIQADERKKEDIQNAEAAKRRLDEIAAIGNAINQQIAQGLAAGVLEGEKLDVVIRNILRQLANRALTNLIFGALNTAFPGAGLAGGLFAGLFGRRAASPLGISDIGISSAQRIIPAAVSRPAAAPSGNINRGISSAQRIAPAAELAPVNITINVNAQTFDDLYVRTKLMPTINKYVKQGARLFSSKTI